MTLVSVSDFHPNVRNIPVCSDVEVSMFRDSDVNFPSLVRPPSGRNRSTATFILEQAFGFGNGDSNYGVDTFSDDFNTAAKQTKVMMTYNIFQGVLKLAERQVEVKLKTMNSMLLCLENQDGNCESSQKYIQVVKRQSQDMYSIREVAGFSLTKIDSESDYAKGAPAPSFALVDENDPALSIIAKYPILAQFLDSRINSDTQFNAEFKVALQKMIDVSSDKLSDFSGMDYGDVMDFPGSIAMSLLDQISILQSSGDLNAPMIAGSYCELVSEIYKRHEYLETVNKYRHRCSCWNPRASDGAVWCCCWYHWCYYRIKW